MQGKIVENAVARDQQLHKTSSKYFFPLYLCSKEGSGRHGWGHVLKWPKGLWQVRFGEGLPLPRNIQRQRNL